MSKSIGNREKNTLLRFVVGSFLYKSLLELRCLKQLILINFKLKKNPIKAYCISPYKTGTTYIAGLFAEHAQVSHEPLNYLTLKNINNIEFLRKRSNYLGLDLECNGAFASRLQSIRIISPTAPVLYILRDPNDWINSFIAYMTALNNRISYNYILRILFDDMTTYPVDEYQHLTNNSKRVVITALLEYWLQSYEEAALDENCLIVDIAQIDSRIDEIELHLGLKSTNNHNVWKREGSSRDMINIYDFIPVEKYRNRIEKLGYLVR